MRGLLFAVTSSSTGFDLSTLTANDVIYGFLGFLFSVLLSFALTPVVRVLAYRIKAVDVPRDKRRMHTEPVPLIGGLGIFVSFALSCLLFVEVLDRRLVGMLFGMLVVVAVGIVDDVKNLRPWVKLVGQILAALIPIFSGVTIDSLIFAGQTITFPWFVSFPLTLVWIVGITNAVNLIDGLDGLACGVSVIAAFCLVLTAIISATNSVALLALLLAGACLGFLPYNAPPAKIFMGDTGALMLGYALATISVIGVFKFNAVISFLVPCLILGIPFSDTVTAIIRRILHHQSPFQADRGHLHHKLVDMGFSPRASVLILYAISALLGICAVMFTGDNVRVAVFVFLIGVAVITVDFLVIKSSDKAREQMGVFHGERKDEETAENKEDKQP
ncbi:MAG: undecaprenyl/decaprenyl-phosphate alpha-N-acetylglucosaminyl 1-phosphate transferase [Clostridia bacterium]|nr:undecaprenyl/decaprenyl-phosphate alpha-N-acetylglucosaminyl 1-phosphate transferase [Clostridia bacterium]